MKNLLTGITLVGLMAMASIAVNAQSVNSSLIVSKDVQRVANKKAFENKNLTSSNIQALSQPFPAIVISKGIVRSAASAPQGNIVSKGYPTWAISKGVARKNQERIHGTRAMNAPDNAFSTGERISRK
jgi:galactitol-specific phosphotransferase system IIB component